MFEWDEEKNKSNKVKHGMDFGLARTVFSGPCVSFEDERFDYGETRFLTLGQLDGRVVVITHTQRGKNTRIISMRKANEQEQETYKERFGTD